MNIIIPVGGKGERFKQAGYKEPKPLIKIFNKEMIFYLLDNLDIREDDNLYIIYNEIINTSDFAKVILKKYPKINLISIRDITKGAVETLYKGLLKVNLPITNKNIVLDCDTFYKNNLLNSYRNTAYNNVVYYRKNNNDTAKFSYIKLNKQNQILDIVEKNKISDNANTGAYCFESIELFMDYAKFILDNNITYKNEPYTSCLIDQMIKNDLKFFGIEMQENDLISLGTPEEVDKYIKDTKTLLFDLDGTLVNTDHIYVKVWNNILKKYNINCDRNFFDHFIKGKNDAKFMKYINSNISNEEVTAISALKDKLFIQYLSENNSEILIDGVIDFFNQNKYNNIAIVTSCNKVAAEYIIQITGLNKYISVLIASEDCNNHKPDPEPYLKAIKYFNSDKDNTFIFEDSFSGYRSAINTKVPNIALIFNENSCSEICKTNEFKFKNYENLSLKNIENFYLDINKEYNNYLLEIKKNICTLPIDTIIKNTQNLKTGYICDIDSYTIRYKNGSSEDIVLKISNFDNELSSTAVKLNMYFNETFFYKKISKLIPNTPFFYGSFKDNDKDAIILENLNKYNGKFNIDLNKNIFLLLNVVKNIHDIHKTFYFETKADVIESMKDLKTINDIKYFRELINERYENFKKNVFHVLNEKEKNIVDNIVNNLDNIYNQASEFPLSFCHGDLKSPNIFYKDNKEPIFLDWQYIHLNKGISDIVFLLVESIDFDEKIVDIVIKFYYQLQNQFSPISFENYMRDFKNSLSIFPLFVCIWFNSESSDKLLDPIFPLRFMKNLMKFYNFYLN